MLYGVVCVTAMVMGTGGVVPVGQMLACTVEHDVLVVPNYPVLFHPCGSIG